MNIENIGPLPENLDIIWERIEDHLIMVYNPDLNHYFICATNQWLYSKVDNPLCDAYIVEDYMYLMEEV